MKSRIGTSGFAALPTVIIIAVVVLIAGIGVLSTGLTEDALTFGEKESREALYAAETGVHDAIERIVRMKNCNSGGIPSCASYVFYVGDASVSVTVSGATTPKTIVATGTRKNKTRRIQVITTIDASGRVTITSWVELSS